MTFTPNVDCPSPTSSVFEDSENEIPIADNGNPLLKHPASSREEGVMTKRVALGVLDSNARRSPRSEKGNNSHVEYVL